MIKTGKLHCALYQCLSALTGNMFYLLSLDWQLSQIRNHPRDRQTSGHVWGTFAEMFQWGGKTRAWHHLVRRRRKWVPMSTALLLTAHAMCWFPQTSASASASSWTLHSNCEPNKTLLPYVLLGLFQILCHSKEKNNVKGQKWSMPGRRPFKGYHFPLSSVCYQISFWINCYTFWKVFLSLADGKLPQTLKLGILTKWYM